MYRRDRPIDSLRQALRMYVFIGVVLVAAGVRSWSPPANPSWSGRVAWTVAEVLLWPKVFPELVQSGRVPNLSGADWRTRLHQDPLITNATGNAALVQI
jgi:hypothetical protein